MVDGMENDLPARDTEVGAIGHDGVDLGGRRIIKKKFEPLAVTVPEFWLGLDEKLEGVLRSSLCGRGGAA